MIPESFMLTPPMSSQNLRQVIMCVQHHPLKKLMTQITAPNIYVAPHICIYVPKGLGYSRLGARNWFVLAYIAGLSGGHGHV